MIGAEQASASEANILARVDGDGFRAKVFFSPFNQRIQVLEYEAPDAQAMVANLADKACKVGFGKIFQAWHRDDPHIAAHEETHSQQIEDSMLRSLIVGGCVAAATGDVWLGLAIWISGGLWQIPNFLTAAARHGWRHAYRDAEHERSAYAQHTPIHGGHTWAGLRDETRREKG